MGKPFLGKGVVKELGTVSSDWSPRAFQVSPIGDLRMTYFSDGRPRNALAPDQEAPLRDIINNISNGGPQKIGSENIFRGFPSLLDSLNKTLLDNVFGAGHFESYRLGMLLTVPVFYATGQPGAATVRTDLHAEPISNVVIQLTGRKKFTLIMYGVFWALVSLSAGIP